MTTDESSGEPAPRPTPTADPAAYDSPRAERARAKGLDAPYITGGEAPDAPAARVEERRLGRLLMVMVVVIVASGFVIGTIVALLGPVTR